MLEVGLGGRLDATNVVTPELCVITPIDFDHEAYLGKSLESHRRRKAGILKPGVPAFLRTSVLKLRSVLEARAAELGVEVTHSSEIADRQHRARRPRKRFHLATDCECVVRCLASIRSITFVPLSRRWVAWMSRSEAIRQGIAETVWPGRLERVAENPEIILDGAHNPAGARALAAYLDRFYDPRRVWLIYGAMRDKAVEEITAILFPRATHVIVTAPAQTRALRPE